MGGFLGSFDAASRATPVLRVGASLVLGMAGGGAAGVCAPGRLKIVDALRRVE